jgi:hypothetical protein
METQPATATLDDVRLAIFRQHTQLEQLFDELEAHANAELRRALDLVTARFARHLEYEEAHLSPWGVGVRGEEPLMGDHDDQRALVRGLVHDRDVFGDARTLSREALAFIHVVRKDMVDEDRKLRALR